MERSSSPSPSTRNLIRSYTTSSDESAAERIAAARAARERRRLERDRDGKMDGEVAHERVTAVEVPRVEVHEEADSQDGESSFDGTGGGGGGQGDDEVASTTSGSLVPKLRVQPSSDRSYTPSVPSTPSRSQPSTSPNSSSTVPLPPHESASPARAPALAHATPPSHTSPATPRRQSFEVANIPAFRPKNTSPIASPSSPSPVSTTPPGTISRPTSPAHVALAGGLMERLKARRAANLAAAAQQSAHPASAPPAASEAGSSAAYTPLSEVLPLPSHEAATPPTSPSQEPVALESPDPAAERRAPAWPGSSDAHTPAMGSDVEQAAVEAPYKARRTVSSKVFGRDGEEVDFEFTQLSDVPEQTERSTLSNWRDSVPQHRRHGSISSASRPASSIFSAPAPLHGTLPKRFSLASSVSSRQQADGSFARPSHSRPLVPGSSSLSAVPETASSSSEHGSRAFEAPDKRIDATSHMLGRSGSTGSIFPASSISSGARSSSSASDRSFVESRRTSPPVRHPSPTRRVSPEVARRAAQFAQVDGPPPSPTKSTSSRSSSPVKRYVPDRQPLPPPPSGAQLVATFPSAPTSRSLTQLPTATTDELKDPLVDISRRREERRRAIEAFQAQLAQDPPSPILCEGYLFTPQERVDGRHDPDSLDGARRYCVLTSAGLDFRPTDQEPGSRPRRAFALVDCALVDDDPPAELAAGGLRPFVVVLKDGRRQDFACESRGERVKWVSALQNAIISSTRDRLRSANGDRHGARSLSLDNLSPTAESTRTITPPGSRFSESRGTVHSFAGPAETSEGSSTPPPWSPRGLGLYSFADDKRRPLVHRELSGRSASTASSHLSYLPEKPTADRGRYDRDLFGLYSTRLPTAVARPSSEHSTCSSRSLPPLPPHKDLSGRVKIGHHRAQSELPTYSTPVDQPPFRPTPTRPTSSRTFGTSSSPSSPSSPEKRLEPSSTADATSYVSPDEVAALERELRELGGKVESAAFPKIKRDERYKRVQERLETLQRRLTSTSTVQSATTSTDKARELDLAEKVDYLLHVVNTTMLDKKALHPVDPQGEEVMMSRVEARIRDLLANLDKPTPISRSPSSSSSPSTIRARAEPDNYTVTTRAGIHSPSEHREWQRDLERFKNDAAVPYPPSASSVASPNTVLRERERASRKLQNLSPLSPNTLEPYGSAGSFFGGHGGGIPAARPRDPFAGSGVVESTESGAARQAPQQSHQQLVPSQPSVRSRGKWGGTASAQSVVSWAESDVGKVEQALFRILDGFERQDGALAENQHHQERIAHVVGELAKWVAEDRSLRDAQFNELIGAVHGVVDHVAELPQRMLASLGAAEAAADVQRAQPTVDHAHDGSDEPNGLADPVETAVVAEDALVQDGSPKKRTIGLNPLSSFAQLDRKMANGDTAGVGGRVKGPRMPGIRLWGAPEPVADRVNRWGGGAVAAKASADELAAEAVLSADAEAACAPHGPVVDALKGDEKLGRALQAIADGSGDEVDAGAVSLAVFEILQTLRDLSSKQALQEAREQAERDKHGGLTLKEMAELEAKRGEIFRLEQETVMNSERTAKINEMVAALAAKTEKADMLLAQIAKNVEEGKTTTMDPALSDEVKRLLGGVRSGVDEHVKDFRGQLTSEVQRMFKEVGKLRDEKKMLQTDIAELMAFAAKQGGGSTGKAAAPAPPPPAVAPSVDLPKPGLPSSGFFGPRAMK
ncbi:uncharacterized protein RHOBADRAFT_55848 [Rhodotorula graminis WP1]|uniref:PH domain-containing protein n=1 Tax=Rhodotorula graminis (strain WP1) TaxID=578459 RepID=A0A0P9GY85_RHOGW|nr:uncharacterized protein RHOBADRAFT_55848 [Rhodotorula graminis WP1]KPV72374.1 hypothetical protein RHOBADRAFT_55848 [Rhodotorula graminis WP1]